MKQLIMVLYSIFLLLFTVFSYAFVDPNLSYLKSIYSGFSFSNRLLVTVLYVFFILIFFIFYSIFIWLGAKKKLKLRNVFILLSVTVGILFFSYQTMLSYDIFNYITTSKVLFFYNENPYIIIPIEFIGEPLLFFTHAANKVALYGPFWIILTGIPYFLGLGNFIITLFSFKIFITVFYSLTVFLIWKISKSLMSVILFALNPLVVIETLISGHNDIVMIYFVILSFFLLMKKKTFYAILLFIFSILIKYATALLIPIFLYIFWKSFKKEEVNWGNIFYSSFFLMLAGFLLSTIREEIYPWYAIWFLSFVFLLANKNFLVNVSVIFSFGLLFRYAPYMLTGTHAGQTPIIKEIISFIFPILYFFYYVLKKKI